MRVVLLLLALVVITWWVWMHFAHATHLRGPPPNWAAAILDHQVVDAHDKAVSAGAIGTTPYTLVYFSAGWCAPCHKFTPQLVSFYRQEQPRHRCTLIMVDEDTSREDERAYITEFDMPWLFARLDGPLWHQLATDYGADGIPQLVLLDRYGAVLADSFDGSTYLGPQHVLDAYQRLVH